MHLHLDCQFGIAGDMVLAALVDAGADLDAVVKVLREIPLESFEVVGKRAARNGVSAMLLEVKDLTGDARPGRHTHDHDHGGHDHSHSHSHDHGHGHGEGCCRGVSGDGRGCGCGGKGGHGGGRPGPHRHVDDLMRLLDADVIGPGVRDRAARVFRILAEAEATVHGQPVDRVHFHEISGIDTAVDVIGSCVALELLGVDSVSASPPAVGSGMVMCEHGIFPVPAPATLEILKSRNIPWRSGGEGERATPTGVALLAGLAESYGDSPEITVTRIGYGAGSREYDDAPNLLRAVIGKPGRAAAPGRVSSKTVIAGREPETSGEIVKVAPDEALLPAAVASMLPGGVASNGDRVVEFRFVVDDMTPEAVAFLCESALAAGAVEAYAVPATMKKGRAGHEVTVLAAPEAAPGVADALWRESTTFGMRVGERSRLTLPREVLPVSVLGHKVRVKIGWRGGKVVRRQPEFDDCRAVALATGTPLGEVFRLAAAAAEGLGEVQES